MAALYMRLSLWNTAVDKEFCNSVLIGGGVFILEMATESNFNLLNLDGNYLFTNKDEIKKPTFLFRLAFE